MFARLILAMLGVVFARSLSAQESRPPRAARSVHLSYPAGEARAFYNELTVEKSVRGSYFMACGFSHGYFGIQELGNGKKVVLFSVWDPTRGNDAKSVPEDQRVEVLFQGEDVTVKRFGGEGTGGQSFFNFDWKVGETYRFLVTAKAEEKKTAYAGWFYLPEKKEWKHLVTFRTRTGGEGLKGLYSFVEDFRRDGKSAGEVRRAVFGNEWISDANGKWQPLTQARFTASSSQWEAKETIDAGAVGEKFYLQTGGETTRSRELRSMIQRPGGEAKQPAVPAF